MESHFADALESVQVWAIPCIIYGKRVFFMLWNNYSFVLYSWHSNSKIHYVWIIKLFNIQSTLQKCISIFEITLSLLFLDLNINIYGDFFYIQSYLMQVSTTTTYWLCVTPLPYIGGSLICHNLNKMQIVYYEFFLSSNPNLISEIKVNWCYVKIKCELSPFSCKPHLKVSYL